MFVRSAIAVALLILVGYGAIEAAPLVMGPSLSVSSPVDGTTSPDGLVAVSGTAKRVTALSLNGDPLLIDEKGAFSRLIVLPRGGAILTLTATDRFGRSITKEESVYVP
jgi:hypothetical protein